MAKTGSFQIWTKETLKKYGFSPKSSPYYAVLKYVEEEAQGIDGFIGETPVQIKSSTYKLEARLAENIETSIDLREGFAHELIHGKDFVSSFSYGIRLPFRIPCNPFF